MHHHRGWIFDCEYVPNLGDVLVEAENVVLLVPDEVNHEGFFIRKKIPESDCLDISVRYKNNDSACSVVMLTTTDSR